MSKRAPISGFEDAPRGRLLEQLLTLDTPMGLAYERAIGFEKSPHTHDRHMLVCPRGSCRMEIRGGRPRKSHAIDATRVLWVPRHVEHDDEGKSAIYDSLALFPDEKYFAAMIQDNGLGGGDQALLEKNLVSVKRSRWLDDLLARHSFERVLNRRSPPGCTYFLEKQILNELVRLLFQEKFSVPASEAVPDTGARLEAAIRFIESNLFEKIELGEIARAAKLSESTLLRQFKGALGVKPYEYLQNRRLDEALALIRRGEHPVSDIALLVGYEDLSAFSRAFRRKFGKAPSRIAR